MSDLEELFATYWRMLGPLDLQDYAREYKFHPIRRWRFDVCFPEHRLAIELDGGQWLCRTNRKGQVAAGGRHNTDKDRVKLNEAAKLGWRVLRFSGEMLENDPAACVETVIEALAFEEPDARRDKTACGCKPWHGDDGPEM